MANGQLSLGKAGEDVTKANGYRTDFKAKIIRNRLTPHESDAWLYKTF